VTHLKGPTGASAGYSFFLRDSYTNSALTPQSTNPSYDGTTAEFIAERPFSNTYSPPLKNFYYLNFTTVKYQMEGDATWYNLSSVYPGDLHQVSMKSVQTSNILAQPYSYTNGGSSFEDDYLKCG
jgi:hypothetical protein